jgi:hypothetical protein
MAHRFDRLADAPRDEGGNLQKKYDIIQDDGLAGVGERVDPGDVYVNKQTPTNANDNAFTGQAAAVPYKNSPMTYKSPVAGNIDKVMISDTENDQTLIKVLIRQTRRPELGDKFSSRHGQKGVCGLIVNQEDMPFNDHGVVPGKFVAHMLCVYSYGCYYVCRFYHEPSRISIPNDCWEDDRTPCWKGIFYLQKINPFCVRLHHHPGRSPKWQATIWDGVRGLEGNEMTLSKLVPSCANGDAGRGHVSYTH